MPNYTLDYETTDDESSVDDTHLPPVASKPRTNGFREKEMERENEEELGAASGDESIEHVEPDTDDAFSIDLNDGNFEVKRTDENEHLFDIDGNYVGEIGRDFESCSDS